MGLIEGQISYKKWERGEKLTRREAIFANCYICNALETSNEYCLGEKSCPLYRYAPYSCYRR